MPQEQHFVPQVYLQRFAFNEAGDLWGLKIRNLHSRAKPKPKRYNKSEICKIPDLYRIHDIRHLLGRNISDENHVENFGFLYERSELTDLFNTLERGKPFLLSQARRLLSIIFSIKRRNPRYIDLIIRHSGVDIESLIDKELEKMKAELASIGLGNLPIDFEKVKQDQLAKMKDEKYKSDIHKGILIDSNVVPDYGGKEKIDLYLSSKFTLYRTSPSMPFITSDNPGFTLKGNKEVYNLELGIVQKLFFPISSRSALMIEFVPDPTFSPILLNKNIQRVKATPSVVTIINEGTACNSLEYIYAGIQDAVNITHQAWKVNNS